MADEYVVLSESDQAEAEAHGLPVHGWKSVEIFRIALEAVRELPSAKGRRMRRLTGSAKEKAFGLVIQCVKVKLSLKERLLSTSILPTPAGLEKRLAAMRKENESEESIKLYERIFSQLAKVIQTDFYGSM